MSWLQQLLFIFWVFIPAGVANMAPVFAAHISAFKKFDTPMDFGRFWHGQRIFGDNKTWRGVVAGILSATVVLAVQQWLVGHTDWGNWLAGDLNYAALPVLIVGPLFAIGVLGGDAVESFFKRRLNIAPGHSWFPFDQIDYIIGGALAVAPFIRLTLIQYVILFALWIVLVMITTYIGFKLRLKDRPV